MSDHRQGRFFGNQMARGELDAYLRNETPTHEQVRRELDEEERIEHALQNQANRHEQLLKQIDFRDLLELNADFDKLLTEMRETSRAIQQLKDPIKRDRFQKINDDGMFELTLDRYAPLRSQVRAKLLKTIHDLHEEAFSAAVKGHLEIDALNQKLSLIKQAIDTGGFSTEAKQELQSECSGLSWQIKRLTQYPNYAPLKQQLVGLDSDIRALFDRASYGLRQDEITRPRLEDPVYLQARRDSVRTIRARLNEVEQTVNHAFPDKDHHGPGWELRSQISNAQYRLKQVETEIDLSRWIPRAEAILNDLISRHEDGETIQADTLMRFKTLLKRIEHMHFFAGDNLERRARRLKEELQELEQDIRDMTTRHERRLLQQEGMSVERILESLSEKTRYYWAYRQLGLDPEDAQNREPRMVRTAYRNLARRYHSDLLPEDLDPTLKEKYRLRLSRITDAYQALQQAGLLDINVASNKMPTD